MKPNLDNNRIDNITLGHISASGPVSASNLAKYLLEQAQGVKSDNMYRAGRAAINRLIQRGEIEVYEGGGYVIASK